MSDETCPKHCGTKKGANPMKYTAQHHWSLRLRGSAKVNPGGSSQSQSLEEKMKPPDSGLPLKTHMEHFPLRIIFPRETGGFSTSVETPWVDHSFHGFAPPRQRWSWQRASVHARDHRGHGKLLLLGLSSMFIFCWLKNVRGKTNM